MTFEERYNLLNKQQKLAVDSIDGPVMVIAGPGTGKTSILTLRIANILKKTDTEPDSILALTFTESGAYSMRKKLADIIGPAAYKVAIYTFHSFCNDVIKNFPEEFPRIIGAQNITDIDQIKILEKIIDNNKLEKLKPYGDTYHYVRLIISEIDNLKKENISPADFAKILKKEESDFYKISDLYHEKGKYKGEMKGAYSALFENIKKNKELQKVYSEYEKELEVNKLYDYQDMILEVIKAMESNRSLLLQLQEKYQYILADEHQDANNSQNRILELISGFHENPNIFIVGDEKQAIFRFQGASLENFLYFKKLYPSAIEIRLEENYRSTQSILDAAHSLIEKNKQGSDLRIKLKAKVNEKNSPIELYSFEKEKNEVRFIADHIKERLGHGVEADKIAVLYRENKDADNIARAMEKVGVPFIIESDQELFSDSDISKIILLMRAINELGNNDILAKALFIDFLEVNYVDIYKILNFAKSNKVSVLDVLHKSKYLEDAGVESKDHLLDLYKKLESWTKSAKNDGLLLCFEKIIRESGFLNHLILRSDSVDKLSKLDKIFEQMKELVSGHKDYKLADFLDYLGILEKHNVVLRTRGKTLSTDAVHLMTAHKSKGLEFDFVYIVKVFDGHWGNKKDTRKFKLPIHEINTEDFDVIDDERRLFYVALTRAKKEVVLTYAKLSEDGKALLPSQFIGEIEPNFLKEKDSKKIEERYELSKDEEFLPSQNTDKDLKNKDYLRKLFFDEGLSVTALNNYLKCPWKYFFSNLIRLPQAPNKHQAYGTAIHETLKYFFDKYRLGEDMTEKEVLGLFEKYLSKQPINKNDYDETLEKGKKSLKGYLKTYKGKWERSCLNEFKIAGVFIDLDENINGFDKILLKGNLDKIEILSDSTVNVVDYKVRKPMTRNEIEGITKNSDGNYFRQLVFYKILLDNLPGNKDGVIKYFMESGELDFIEPNERGLYKKEKFFIDREKTDLLIKTIQKSAKEISNFEFWDKTCRDKKCEYCELKKMMK